MLLATGSADVAGERHPDQDRTRIPETMRTSATMNAARAAVCVLLLAAAMAATVQERERDGPSLLAAPELTAQMQLRRAVHPASDPQLGELWSASRNLVVPVQGVSPDDLVDTFSQIRGPERRHEAIDIPAPRGTPVVAVTDGEVVRTSVHDSGGISLYLLAPDGQTIFYYAHLLDYAEGIRAGARVRQGDVVGFVGDTGNPGAGNYHLHFEVMTAPNARQYHALRPRNPYPLLIRARG